jgi:dienelactone hydrolase
MGGPFAVWTAAAAPERVKAVASFHGGGLVGEEATSPVKMIAQTQASYLFAIAATTTAPRPATRTRLKAAADAAGRPVEIKVYRADHGWTVADLPAYNYDEDDASWERLLELYSIRAVSETPGGRPPAAARARLRAASACRAPSSRLSWFSPGLVTPGSSRRRRRARGERV